MKLSCAIWQMLLVFVVMSFLVSGLSCGAALPKEQDEEMLVVRVFAPLVEDENESLPIEGAQVYIWPDASLRWASEEAEREFYLRGVTNENGVVVFNLSRSLYYFNASIYYIYASAIHYETPFCMVNITETREVSVYLGESPKHMRVLNTPTDYSFLLFLAATIPIGAMIAWGLKRKRSRKKRNAT